MNIKKIALPLIAAGALSAGSVAVAEEGAAAKFENNDAKIGYAFGVMFGQRMRNELGNIDLDQFADGMKTAFNGEPQLMSDEEIAQTRADLQGRH